MKHAARGRWVCATAVVLAAAGMLRADGLPGEYLLTQRWREHFGQHSPLSNPAFITQEDYISARIAVAPVLQGSFVLGEFGVTVPLGWHQAVGLTLVGEDDGDVEAGVFDPVTGELVEGGAPGSNENLFVMLSYAINLWRQLSIGANVNIGYQSNFGRPLTGLGLDLGAAYRLLRHPVAGEHTLGVYVQNLLPPTMSDSGLSVSFKGVGNYTGDLKFSWIGKFLERRLEGGLDFYLKDFLWAKGEFKDLNDLSAVTDAKLEWALTARVGVWFLRILEARLQFGFDNDALDYWGLAGGINVPSINRGRDFQVLYQYNLKTEGDAASTHTFYVRTDFGKHREELYAKKLAKRMSIAPNELYTRAMTLFNQGQYWDAFFVFSQIVLQYPDFFKNDRVSYYRGRCLQMLDMRDMARNIYENTIHEYSRSDIVPYAELGLVEIHYREGAFDRLLEHYLKLNRPDSPDSLVHHGGYLMGEALMRQGRMRDALAVLDKIPPTHPEYAYARHSAAVASFVQDNLTGTRDALAQAIETRPRTPEEAEVVYRSYVLLGYLFYEQESLAEAITALRLVPPTSFYYAEALLGQAWTALRARQWGDCRAAALALQKATSDPVLQQEASLLTAYTHLLQGDHSTALGILQRTSQRLDSIAPPSAEELRLRRAAYERDRFAYDSLANDVIRVSLLLESPQNQRAIDSMHVTQMQVRRKLDDFYRFQDGFHRRTFFARGLEQVKSDVNYALAVTQTIVGRRGVIDAQKKAAEKQQQIDAEIERLKKQVETLDKGQEKPK